MGVLVYELEKDNCTVFQDDEIGVVEDVVVPIVKSNTVTSLQTLSAITLSNYVNYRISTPNHPQFKGDKFPPKVAYFQATNILSLPTHLLVFLAKFLHYRFLKYLIIHFPQIREEATPFLSISKRREEDLLRTRNDEYERLAEKIPLINVYQSLDSFKWLKVQPSSILLKPCKPPQLEDLGMVAFNNRLTNTEYWEPIFKLKEGSRSIVSEEEFLNNWKIFTEKQLVGINWENVFAAGGAVAACLTPALTPLESDSDRRQWYHEVAYETSDIDLFLYGLTETLAKKKVQEIFAAICENHTDQPRAVLTPNAVTIFSEYPKRCIQINISMYRTKAEVLANFDLDCVCVGYDGKNVWTLSRGRDALNTRTNTINGGLKKLSFIRMDKYRGRGYQFAVPQFLRIPSDGILSDEKAKLVGSVAKMRHLSRHDICFEHDTNIRKWASQEWAYGYTEYLDKRAPVRIENDLKFYTRGGYQDTGLESEGSCGMYFYVYNQYMTKPPKNKYSVDTPENIPHLWTMNYNDMWHTLEDGRENESDKSDSDEEDTRSNKRKKHVKMHDRIAKWFGAPDFIDWDVSDDYTFQTDFSQLSYIEICESMSIQTDSLPQRIIMETEDDMEYNLVLVAEMARKNLCVHFELEFKKKPSLPDNYIVCIALPLIHIYGTDDDDSVKRIQTTLDAAHYFNLGGDPMIPIEIYPSTYQPHVNDGKLSIFVDVLCVEPKLLCS